MKASFSDLVLLNVLDRGEDDAVWRRACGDSDENSGPFVQAEGIRNRVSLRHSNPIEDSIQDPIVRHALR